MDIENLRKNQTQNQLRIRELKRQQAQLVRQQKQVAAARPRLNVLSLCSGLPRAGPQAPSGDVLLTLSQFQRSTKEAPTER